MDRKEILEILENNIPSFRREFNDKDFFGEKGWMLINKQNMPMPLPKDFLVGEKFVRDGKEFTIADATELGRRDIQNRDMPEGRHVTISYHNYAGNPHLYGVLTVYGVEAVHMEGEKIICTSVSEKQKQENPILRDASYSWEIELCRILPEQEYNETPGMWEGYSPGDRTQRFLSGPELILTGLYAALENIDGPFFVTLHDGSYYEKKDLLLTVDKKGNAEPTDLLKRITKQTFEK